MSFARNTLLSLGGYGCATALALLCNALVGRQLGPRGQGVYALLTVFVALVSLLSGAGLGPAAAFYIGRGRFAIARVIGTLAAAAAAIGILTTVALLLLAVTYSRAWLPQVPVGTVALMAALTPFMLARLYAEHVFIGAGDFLAYNALTVLDPAVRLAVMLPMLAAGFDVSALGFAIAAGTCGCVLAAAVLLHRRLGLVRPRVDRTILRALAGYGTRSYVSGLFAYLNLRLDQFLVAWFLDIEQVGYYAAAVALSELGAKLANVTTKTLFARVTTLNSLEATLLTGRAMRVTMTVALVLSTGTAIVAGPLVTLVYGSRFAVAVTPLRVLLAGTVMLSAAQLLQSDLAGRGMPEVGTVASAVSVGVSVAGNLWLTRRFGVTGAAASATAAYAGGAAVLLIAYRRVSGQSARDLLWVTHDDVRQIARLIAWQPAASRRPE